MNIVYIGTINDSSGNPRRGWIIGYDSGDPRFVDEGYEGRQALARYDIAPAAGDVPRIEVAAREYRSWMRVGPPEPKEES